MEKVIFDTQVARNPDAKNFLGNRTELEKFSKSAIIIFPDIVLEEIRNQKRRNLKNKKQSFLDNPFHWLRTLDRDETKNFDIDVHVEELERTEELKYVSICLTDYTCLEQMKELALKKLPPFESGDNTDKGFKDAYIYFTVLEYMQKTPDKKIFVCCRDGKLKEAFEKYSNIIIIRDYDDFQEKSIVRYQNEYFIEKLHLEKGLEVRKENILDFWTNINDNHILDIKIDNGEEFVVEIDEGEILNIENKVSYESKIDELCYSGGFDTTHSSIATLESYMSYFSDDEIIRILEATRDNNQINWIIGDDDVKQFIGTLYEKKKDILPPDLEIDIKMKLE